MMAYSFRYDICSNIVMMKRLLPTIDCQLFLRATMYFTYLVFYVFIIY